MQQAKLKKLEGVDAKDLEFDHHDDENRKPEKQLSVFWQFC